MTSKLLFTIAVNGTTKEQLDARVEQINRLWPATLHNTSDLPFVSSVRATADLIPDDWRFVCHDPGTVTIIDGDGTVVATIRRSDYQGRAAEAMKVRRVDGSEQARSWLEQHAPDRLPS